MKTSQVRLPAALQVGALPASAIAAATMSRLI
jgi:hypothetical protein